MRQFLHEYRTFFASPQAELALEILEAMPALLEFSDPIHLEPIFMALGPFHFLRGVILET